MLSLILVSKEKKMTENDKIKTVILVNKAQFKFSRYFDEDKLNEKLLRIKTLNNSNQLPILPKIADVLEEEVIRKSIHSTAGIEGNTLTEDEVANVLGKADKEDLLEDSEKQIKNLQNAYRLLKEVKVILSFPIIGENHILEIHKSITSGLKNEGNTPGKYRRDGVIVGDKEHGGIYSPPKIAKDINNLMSDYVRWLSSGNVMVMHPIYRAALAHYHFGKIHPFGDGNGRTARIIEAVLLRCAGYKYAPEMLSNYYYRNLDEYFIIFNTTIRDKKQDLTPFIDFMMDGMIWSLEEIHKKLMVWVRQLVIKEYYLQLRESNHLTQRQYDLLMVLISFEDEKFEFSAKNLISDPLLKILYRSVQARASGRDLTKLEKMNLITKSDSNLYKINLERLG